MRTLRFLSRVALFTAVLSVQILTLPENSANSATLNDNYPRLANYCLRSSLDQGTADNLKKWDVVILNSDVGHSTPSKAASIRALNPNVTLLAYVNTMIVVKRGAPGHDRYYNNAKLLAAEASGSPGWWLYDQNGNHVSRWPDTWSLNLSEVSPIYNGNRWSSYLADFVRNEIMKDFSWDGVFYDDAHQYPSWMNKGNLDLDNNRVQDSSSFVDTQWSLGLESLLSRTRQNLGPTTLILGNGHFDCYGAANGRMIESFPTYGKGNWYSLMDKYNSWMANGLRPRLVVINANNGNTGDQFSDLRKMRFTLTSTLLGDGYFSYDYGGTSHGQLWWYDEYSVDANGNATGNDSAKGYLGQPEGMATQLANGLWRRDFDGGIVLSNPTSGAQTINLETTYKKIKGNQAPEVNDGSAVQSATIPSQDGIILLGPSQRGASLTTPNQPAASVPAAGSSSRNSGGNPTARVSRSPVSGSPSAGEIVGSVVNPAGRPIGGVRVRVGASLVPTNRNGNFRFTKVHPGKYTIYYSLPGYGSRTQTIEVKVGTVLESAKVVLSWWRFFSCLR